MNHSARVSQFKASLADVSFALLQGCYTVSRCQFCTLAGMLYSLTDKAAEATRLVLEVNWYLPCNLLPLASDFRLSCCPVHRCVYLSVFTGLAGAKSQLRYLGRQPGNASPKAGCVWSCICQHWLVTASVQCINSAGEFAAGLL